MMIQKLVEQVRLGGSPRLVVKEGVTWEGLLSNEIIPVLQEMYTHGEDISSLCKAREVSSKFGEKTVLKFLETLSGTGYKKLYKIITDQ